MNIDPTARISLKAKLDLRNPGGIHVGRYSYIAFDAVLLSHDMASGKRLNTKVGDCCFIGARSFLMPGVTIGDHSIVAACAVVTKDVPPHSIVAGNPAKVIKSDINTIEFGQIVNRD